MVRALIPLVAVGGISAFATAESAPTVYIPLGSANEILIVDAATSEATGRIVDVINPHGLAATPDGRFLIAGSNQEVSPDAGNLPPRPVGMSEEEHRSHHQAPGANATTAIGKSHVAILSTADGSVVRRVDVKGAVHHNAVTPDGRYAISTHTTAGGMSIIDLNAFKVIKTIPTGPVPNYAVITHDGRRIFVSNAGNNTISEVDTENWIVKRNFLVGKGPEHLVLSPDETKLFVNNVAGGDVSVLDLKIGKVVNSYKVGEQPHGIDISDNGTTLFVASKKQNKLVAITLADGQWKTVSLQPAPYHVATIPGTGKLYVSSREEPKIWVLEQNSLQVLNEIPITGEGHQMVVLDR
jgi:YVTN family beta-propeller protein